MPPLIAAALVVFLEVLSFGAIFPVMSRYCEELGASPEAALSWTGLMFLLVGAPRIIMNTVWGRLSDHFGRKPILAIATLGTFGGSILWALAPSLASSSISGLAWLAISRLFAGCFQAQATLTQAIAADVSRPEKRAAAMGHLGAAFGFGMFGGIIMGGVVGDHLALNMVGWAMASAQGLSLLIILFVLRETHPEHDTDRALDSPDILRAPLLRLMRTRAIVLPLVITLVMTAGHMILVPTLPTLCQNWYGYEREIKWVFAFWMFIGVLVQGGGIRPMVRCLGEPRTILIGLILLSAGFFWFATHPPLWAFWTAAILIAIGGSLATPALSGWLSRNTSVGDQGSVQGLNQSLTALGRSISYAAVALIAKFTTDLSLHYWFAGGLVVLAAILMTGASRQDRSPTT